MAALRQDARNVRKQTLFLEKHKNVTTKSFYITSDGFIQTFRFYLILWAKSKSSITFCPLMVWILLFTKANKSSFWILFSIISNLKVTQNYGAKIVQIHYGRRVKPILPLRWEFFCIIELRLFVSNWTSFGGFCLICPWWGDVSTQEEKESAIFLGWSGKPS